MLDNGQLPEHSTVGLNVNMPEPSYTPQITIINDYLQSIQRRHAFAITFFPLLGVILAIFQVWKYGVSPIDMGALLAMYGLTVIGVEVGFHRYFSHKSFDAHPSVRWLLGILGSMAAQGPVIYWAANHRRHHQFSDRRGDPHSPYLHGQGFRAQAAGLWHAHMGWIFNHETPNPGFFTKDMRRDPLIGHLDRHYLVWIGLGLLIPAIAVGWLTQSWMGLGAGLLWGGLVRIFLVNQGTTFIVNSVCHALGRRTFKTGDYSANNIWLALPTFGGSWHNNHHAFPHSAITGLEWWQLDLSGWVIRMLKRIGLAWNVKQPTRKMIQLRTQEGKAAPHSIPSSMAK